MRPKNAENVIPVTIRDQRPKILVLIDKLQDIARLTIQRFTNSFQGAETHSHCFAPFYRQLP